MAGSDAMGLIVHTTGVPAQPGSVAGILKVMVSPELSVFAWAIAQRKENEVGAHGAAESAVVVTVSVEAASAGIWKVRMRPKTNDAARPIRRTPFDERTTPNTLRTTLYI